MKKTCIFNDEIVCTVKCSPLCSLHPKHKRGKQNENTI